MSHDMWAGLMILLVSNLLMTMMLVVGLFRTLFNIERNAQHAERCHLELLKRIAQLDRNY